MGGLVGTVVFTVVSTRSTTTLDDGLSPLGQRGRFAVTKGEDPCKLRPARKRGIRSSRFSLAPLLHNAPRPYKMCGVGTKVSDIRAVRVCFSQTLWVLGVGHDYGMGRAPRNQDLRNRSAQRVVVVFLLRTTKTPRKQLQMAHREVAVHHYFVVDSF